MQTNVYVDEIVTRVARFFLLQQTKIRKNVPNDHKMYQIGCEICRIAGKLTEWPQNIFHCKTLQNRPKLGFLVSKHHLATLIVTKNDPSAKCQQRKPYWKAVAGSGAFVTQLLSP
jgi:hypothetical protein